MAIGTVLVIPKCWTAFMYRDRVYVFVFGKFQCVRLINEP
jgi:hypothetical protein